MAMFSLFPTIQMDLARMRLLNAVLHCHSIVSDGWLVPAEVVGRAKTNGVEL